MVIAYLACGNGHSTGCLVLDAFVISKSFMLANAAERLRTYHPRISAQRLAWLSQRFAFAGDDCHLVRKTFKDDVTIATPAQTIESLC